MIRPATQERGSITSGCPLERVGINRQSQALITPSRSQTDPELLAGSTEFDAYVSRHPARPPMTCSTPRHHHLRVAARTAHADAPPTYRWLMAERVMVVTFRRQGRGCSWTALRPPRTIVPGPTMAAGGDLPHDLYTFVIEDALGIEYGFWGCVAAGATFKTLGRKRTPQGKAVIARHPDDLDAAEHASTRSTSRGEPASRHRSTASSTRCCRDGGRWPTAKNWPSGGRSASRPPAERSLPALVAPW